MKTEHIQKALISTTFSLHLGNVRSVIGDTKWNEGNGIFRPAIISYTNYYPFGMAQAGRSHNSTDYKFGYNGKEKDDEIKGSGNSVDFGARMLDTRVGRFLSLDPLASKAADYTPYRFGFNNPIKNIDVGGLYETDGHYWTVYLAAKMLQVPDAQKLAYYTELPDTKMDVYGKATQQNDTWLYLDWQVTVHALNGKSFNENHDIALKNILFSSRKNYYQLGQALHYLGDSYAHTFLTLLTNRRVMYSEGLGHLFMGHTPDKVSYRPELYDMYVRDLVYQLSSKFFYFPEKNFDYFTFDYISSKGGTTLENSAILEFEIRIRENKKFFMVQGDQVQVLTDYLNASNIHFQREVKIKKTFVTHETCSDSCSDTYQETMIWIE